MIVRFAWYEFRQQLGGRIFWIVFAVSVLMVTGSMAIDDLRVGLSDQGGRTGAGAIVQMHLVWTLFFLFTAAAFVGEAGVRDEVSGFANLVRATTVNRRRYGLGRFLGALFAVLVCFGSVPIGIAAGGAMLGFGAGADEAHLYAFFVLALPNLFLASALFFTLVSVTRSMTGCLLGAAGLLTLYGLAGHGSSAGAGLIEPFGFAAVAEMTAGWGHPQRDALLPAFAGILLANRVLWFGLAVGLAGLGTWLTGSDAVRNRGWGSRSIDLTGDPAVAVSAARLGTWQPIRALKVWRPDWIVMATQLQARTVFEARQVLVTPVFAVLLLMGLVAAAAAAARVTGTSATVAALANSFQLVPIVVALFFAGELFWAESECNIAPLVAVTPAGRTALILPKLVALALIFLLLATVSAVAGVAVELAKGERPALSVYLAWYVVPKAYEWLLIGAFALFLQSLAPNKLAGWGYMIFYLIGSLALSRLGWQDPHYRYGGYPGAPLPPGLSGADGVGWYRLGWGAVATAMVVAACRRGSLWTQTRPSTGR